MGLRRTTTPKDLGGVIRVFQILDADDGDRGDTKANHHDGDAEFDVMEEDGDGEAA